MGKYECAVAFQNDSPASGIFVSLEEDRPYQWACETFHRHDYCGNSTRCDENSYTVQSGEETPLYFHFCQDCTEKIKKYCKFSGDGPFNTKEMQASHNHEIEQQMKKKKEERDKKTQDTLERRNTKKMTGSQVIKTKK